MNFHNVRQLCVQNNWFNAGGNNQYNKMFDKVAEGCTPHEIALLIWICSSHVSLEEIENALTSLTE